MYGDPLEHPQKESYWGNVNPIGPRGVYDESKRYAEAMTMAYHRQQGVDTCIARIFNTYGPRMRPNDGRAVPTFIRQALGDEPLTVFGDGSQTRSFCYVDDLVEGLVRLAESGVHDPVNLGNPRELTLLELADLVRDVTGSAAEVVFQALPPDDPRVRCPDITRATELLDWEPRVSCARAWPGLWRPSGRAGRAVGARLSPSDAPSPPRRRSRRRSSGRRAGVRPPTASRHGRATAGPRSSSVSPVRPCRGRESRPTRGRRA